MPRKLHDVGRRLPNVPSVALIPEWYGKVMSPCASIRMHAFLDELDKQGKICLEVIIPDEISSTRADVFAWHRVALDEATVAELGKHAGSIGARLLYDIDDNLLDMDDHREREAYRPLQRSVHASLNAADVVWCSTRRLAQRVRGLHAGRVEHQSNVLAPGIWSMPDRLVETESRKSLNLIYMGTRTHEDDYEFLSRCVDRANKSGLNVKLDVIGIRERDTKGPSWLTTRRIPERVGSSYPAFVHWLEGLSGFDVGVAPLLSSPFNDCKSHIKVLDYAALGLPSIASDMPAYADELSSGSNALLARNDEQSWVEAMAMIRDAGMRRKIADGAMKEIGRQRFEDACQVRLASLAG